MGRSARNVALFVGATACVVVACQKVPVTGRRQLNLAPDSMMQDLGRSTFQEMVQQQPVERGTQDAQLLRQVGARISSKAHNDSGFAWEFALLDDDAINAWCLPGGFVGFYSGILPVLENEAGLAFVMGHEVAHATARHSAERMSQQLALVGGLAGLDLYLSGREGVSNQQRQLIMGALGHGAQVGVQLPFSRTHESEADTIGLMYMARAGYPPEESVEVWNRMEAQGGARPPTFLSTHPSPAQRRENLQEWMPTARKKYARNRRTGEQPLANRW